MVVPPGLTDSSVSSDAVPLTVTLVLFPAASVPDDGETVTSPRRLEGSVIVHCTGPFSAVSVMVEPDCDARVIVVGDTDSSPGAADGDAEGDGDLEGDDRGLGARPDGEDAGEEP
jgi:hypothetical protein